jgi:hypothetical protein
LSEHENDRSALLHQHVRRRKAPYLVQNLTAVPAAVAEARRRWETSEDGDDASVLVLSTYEARLLAAAIGAIERVPGELGEDLRLVLDVDVLRRIQRHLHDLGEFPAAGDLGARPVGEAVIETVYYARERAMDVRRSLDPPVWALKGSGPPTWRRAALCLARDVLRLTSSRAD